jgi:hypothetical protein
VVLGFELRVLYLLGRALLLEPQVWWLMLVIPATSEVEIGRITAQGQPRQNVSETPS